MYDIKNLNIWKKETKVRQSKEYLKSDISELNLSVRSYNCLKRAGCNTVEDVIRIIESDENGLKKIRNLGSRSETEILERIRSFKEEYKTVEIVAEGELPIVKRKSMYNAESIWNSSIEDYHLSNYALNGLKAHGINQVKDLYATNPKDEPGWYAVRELFEKLPAVN